MNRYENNKYENAQYINDREGNHTTISVVINGEQSFVPVDDKNLDYCAIMMLVFENKLTVQEA